MTISKIDFKTDVKQTIEDFKSREDNFQSVILIALNKDGTPFLMTSTMSGFEQAYLVQFVHSWMSKKL